MIPKHVETALFADPATFLVPARTATDEEIMAFRKQTLAERMRFWRRTCGAWHQGQAMKELGLILEALADTLTQ